MKYRRIRKIKKKINLFASNAKKKTQRKKLIYVIYHKAFLHN